MYLWNLHALKSELRARGVSEANAFRYLLASLCGGALALTLVSALPPQNVWDYLVAPVSYVIMIAGTVYCYRVNGGSHGTSFLNRYICLGWVCGVRWFVMVVLPSLLAVVAARLAFAAGDETTWYEVVFWGAIQMIVYWRIGVHIADVVAVEERPNQGIQPRR